MGADPTRPALGRRDPLADLPGRIVSHVLAVPATELGHPVALDVLMESDDIPLHLRAQYTNGSSRKLRRARVA